MRGRTHDQAARCSRRICNKKEKEAKKKKKKKKKKRTRISILVQPVLSFPISIHLVLFSLSLSFSYYLSHSFIYFPCLSSFCLCHFSLFSLAQPVFSMSPSSFIANHVPVSSLSSSLVPSLLHRHSCFEYLPLSLTLSLSYSRIEHRSFSVPSPIPSTPPLTLARSVHYSLISLSVLPPLRLLPRLAVILLIPLAYSVISLRPPCMADTRARGNSWFQETEKRRAGREEDRGREGGRRRVTGEKREREREPGVRYSRV